MTYYKAYIGTWHDTDGVKRIAEGYSRKAIFEKSQEVANRQNRTVDIIAERGMNLKFYLIKPEATA